MRILIQTRRRHLDIEWAHNADEEPVHEVHPQGDVYTSTERARDTAQPEMDARRPIGFHQ